MAGMLLLVIDPMRFYNNIFFWAKMAMLLVAGANTIGFHLTTYRSVANWDREARTPFPARFASVASLTLWAGIGRVATSPTTGSNRESRRCCCSSSSGRIASLSASPTGWLWYFPVARRCTSSPYTFAGAIIVVDVRLLGAGLNSPSRRSRVTPGRGWWAASP